MGVDPKISSAMDSMAKAFTMTIINPWAYRSSVEILTQMGITIAAKAAVYYMDSLSQLYGNFGGSINIAGVETTEEELRVAAVQMAEIAVAKFTISSYSTKYFMFRLNPNKLDKGFLKIRDNKLTGAGLVQDTHGNNGITYTYNGTMGSMYPALSPFRMPQLTPAWYYLQLFEKFYIEHDQDLIFLLDNEVIIGRFDSFSYGLDANNPWLINYRFQATMYSDTKYGLLDGYVGAAFNSIKPDLGNPLAVVSDPFKGDKPTSSHIDVFADTYGRKHAEELSKGGLF